MNKKYFFALFFLFSFSAAQAKLIQYHLNINSKTVNFTGQDVKALGINNQIPAPTVEATVGDTLEITVTNHLDEESSIHWHGVLLPNDQDGVPYLTTQPIKAHTSFTYRFKVKHSGTYWYHSHSGLQEQQGIYGSIIFHPKGGERFISHKDHVVVMSDWTDEHPDHVLANLKKDGDWYALKKDTVQSWYGVLSNGIEGLKNRLNSSWTRMGPMDLSDVAYDAFLVNGKRESYLKAQPGDIVRLRLINAGASTYFNVEFAGAPMIVVATDGVNIDPLKVKRLRMAVAETYDVLIKIPDGNSYELRTSSEDGTGYASLFIGQDPQNGVRITAPEIPRPNLFLVNHSMHNMDGMKMMDHESGGMDHSMHNMKPKKEAILGGMDHSMHDMSKMSHGMIPMKKNVKKPTLPNVSASTVEYLTDYKAIKSPTDTTLPEGAPTRQVRLELTGNMERYVWSFNNKTLAEEDKIFIKKGENVTFTLVNKTMMHHPMHLHGHFFRVLNGQGNRSPLKHTVNVAPMETIEIEFEANEEKDWFFHCHNLYHMKNGMARFVSYEKTTQATAETTEKLGHDSWYFMGDIAALSQMTTGKIRSSNTRNAFVAEYDYNYEKEYDIDLMYERSFTRFFDIYVGTNIERASADEKQEATAIIGLHYMLPLLIESDVRLDSKRKLRFGLGSNLQLTSRLKFSWMWNTNREHRFGLSYELTKNAMLTVAYDSDFKWGAGVRAIF
tara:strand:- start:363 stop:2534 length:2172 start_codon:yes stop_codon:yes gene_type:complete